MLAGMSNLSNPTAPGVTNVMNGVIGWLCQGIALVCKKATVVFCQLAKDVSGISQQAGD